MDKLLDAQHDAFAGFDMGDLITHAELLDVEYRRISRDDRREKAAQRLCRIISGMYTRAVIEGDITECDRLADALGAGNPRLVQRLNTAMKLTFAQIAALAAGRWEQIHRSLAWLYQPPATKSTQPAPAAAAKTDSASPRHTMTRVALSAAVVATRRAAMASPYSSTSTARHRENPCEP